MKNLILNAVKFILILIICASIALIILTLVCLIPRDRIYNNAKKSAIQLNELGEKRKEGFHKNNINFYFTDILMINTVYSIDSNKPLESALLMRKNYTESTNNIGEMPKDVLGDDKFKDQLNGSSKELIALINNDVEQGYIYARYWHGYNIILRPLLVLFNYNIIRLMLCIITIVLLITMVYKIFKDYSKITAIMFLLCLIILEYFTATICINANICFLISVFACNIILYKKNLIKNYLIFFFVIGIITNFLDLLTNPVITLGLPLTIFFVRYNKINTEAKIKEKILMFIKICISWSMGYALFWILKWIICDLILGTGIIKNAFTQILYRTNEQNISILKLISVISLHTTSWNYVIMIILNIVLMIFNRNVKKYIEYILISLLPIIWMLVIRNHSVVHHFFTYRNLLIFIFANLIILEINLKELLKSSKIDTRILNEKEIEKKESDNL